MRHAQGSLAARLAKLEQRHAPTLAYAAEVHVFGRDGERITDERPPPAAGRLRAVQATASAKASRSTRNFMRSP